jgi:hypothetical protein
MEADSLELARGTVEQLGEERVGVAGEGAVVRVDVPAVDRALTALARCALRHGGLERVELHVDGPELRIAPITASAAASPASPSVQMATVSGTISIKIAASMNPAPRATRYLRRRSFRRCAPEDASISPPTRLATAASVPKTRSPPKLIKVSPPTV